VTDPVKQTKISFFTL